MTTRVRAHYKIHSRPAFDVLAIIDLNDGACSVTNDAEAVVEQLRATGDLRRDDRLIYMDTDGVWDELAVSDRGFTGFASLRAATPAAAVERMKKPQADVAAVPEENVPINANHIGIVLQQLLTSTFNDPVVEIHRITPRHLRIRVGQDQRRGPRYFNVKVSEEK